MSEQFIKQMHQAVENSYQEVVQLLSELIAIPSVAAQHRKIPEAVHYLAGLIRNLQGTVTILDDLPGNPVVYGFFPAGPGGNSERTLLFYNHYDVQPEEPISEWNSDPFELVEHGGKLLGRGVGDNKGDIIARLMAIKLLQEQPDGLPCNVKLMIEGEEEIGSPHLAANIEKYSELFAADACIWEFGYKDETERLGLVAGLKGLLYFELSCQNADQDLHSLVSGYVDNPLFRLSHALSSLKNEQGQVLVEGFYDGVQQPTEAEIQAVSSLPFDGNKLKEIYGLRLPLLTERSGKDARLVVAFDPLLTICGIHGGYTGEGAKMLVPREAVAKLEARLVSGQEPDQVVLAIRKHLDKHGFEDINIHVINDQQKGFRSDFSDPFIQLVKSTAEAVYPDGVTLTPSHPGCGPMYDLGSVLKLPIVSTGIGWIGSNYHAPNESVRVEDLKQGIVHLAFLLREYGKA